MRLFIYGAGGIGRETFDIAKKINLTKFLWNEIIFIDDFRADKWFYEARVFSYEKILESRNQRECQIVIANGEPSVRKLLSDRIRSDKYALISIIDPTASISASARIGDGAIIFPNTFISSCAILRENVLINAGSIIGHDTLIGDNTVVSPIVSISGNCSIGSECFVGTKACIKEGVRIGDNAILGMGSCVFRDVDAGMIALGNPARVVKPNSEKKVFG